LKISLEFLLRLTKYVSGLCILAFGISLIILSDIGAGPWDLLSMSLSDVTFLTVGNWQIVLNIAMIFITRLFITNRINLLTLIPGAILGFMVDYFMIFMELTTIPPINLLILGLLACGAGISLYVNQGLVANAIDNFTFQLHHKYNLTLDISKIITDLIPVIIILLFFRHSLTFATLIIYIAIPISIKIWVKVFQFLKIL